MVLKRFRFTAITFLVAFLIFGCSEGGKPSSNRGAAPDFELTSFENTKIKLSDFQDKTAVLLAFWATWCPPCVEEIPLLNQIHEKYSKNNQLHVLSVNVGEDRQKIESFKKDHPINYPILLDLNENVSQRYEISGLPVIVIVAKNGEILYYGFTVPNLEGLVK